MRDDVVADLLMQIEARANAAGAPSDTLNRCSESSCVRPGASAAEIAAEHALRRLPSLKGRGLSLLPEVSWLRVRVPGSPSADLLYGLVREAAHTNVAFMFGEKDRRIPQDDTLTVVRGPFGSHPNFFFDVDASELDAFVSSLQALEDDGDRNALVARWGVRRTDRRFWSTTDWLHAELRRRSPTEAGILDLGRYQDL